MKLERIILVLLVCLSFSVTQAKPRTETQLRTAAAQALTRHMGVGTVMTRQLLLFQQNDDYAVLGYADGGFSIVAVDDALPAVLGYSPKNFRPLTDNPNFRWWLSAVCQVSRQVRNGREAQAVTPPDTSKYPASVPTLMHSEWGQTDPYWNACPVTYDTCVVGCVATAMSQILYYHRLPEKGKGSHSVTVNWSGGSQTYTADFGETEYDFDNMLDVYATAPYTDQQAAAVAQLCAHCGISVDMEYDPEGSGAYSQTVADALRRYFGFSNASYLIRDYYNEREWMNILYEQLSKGWPVYYSGVDYGPDGGGHAFVVDGYDENGLVSVNWGWNGAENGYYNIAMLDPFFWAFSGQQGAVINIEGNGPHGELLSGEVTLSEAGTLCDMLDPDHLLDYRTLKVSGPVNGSDLKVMRQMAGRDENGVFTRGNLQQLDISESRIVAGGEAFLVINGHGIFTANDVLPELAFYNCRSLRKLVLPEGIKIIGKGAFALCNRLDSIVVPIGTDKKYDFDGYALYDKADPSLLISVLPSATGDYEVRAGTIHLSDYAFAGCNRLHKVVIPGSVVEIGNYGFYQCNSLMELRCNNRIPPQIGRSPFAGIRRTACSLYVPAGSKNAYGYDPEWGYFAEEDMICEFGSAITARNAGRDYGEENPAFGYQVGGDRPNGIPELICEATPESPVGEYVIHVNPGTITDEVVDYIDGVLKVWPATLKVRVPDYTRYVGQENPEFELVYEGFKLDETPDVLLAKPVAVTTATTDSPAGEYPITISGGDAQNYEFRYFKGVLRVEEDPSGVRERTFCSQPVVRSVYTLDGRLVTDSMSVGHLPKGIYLIGGRKYVVK